LRSNNFTLKIIPDYDIVICHDGYLDEVVKSKNKLERNIKLLEKTLQIEPLNARWNYFLLRDGYELFDATYAIKKIKKILKYIDKKQEVIYKKAIIDMLIRYQLKGSCPQKDFEKTLDLLGSIEPNNKNIVFYRGLFQLNSWKIKAKEMLDYLIEYREDNQMDMPEMLHTKGFHLDSIIAIYLFERGYYQQAEKLFSFLVNHNYHSDMITYYFSLLQGRKTENREGDFY
jgi:tetratricopeptide (TPR) repeat protein